MITEVYDALRSANADEAMARRAAEVLANHDDRFVEIGLRLQKIESRLGFQQWQIGLQAAILLAIGLPSLWLLVRVAAKVGALGG